MDRYKYNNNLSNKLNLVLFTSINSNIKIKNDPIPYLLTNYSEIEAFFELKNETKILYFNLNIFIRQFGQFRFIQFFMNMIKLLR